MNYGSLEGRRGAIESLKRHIPILPAMLQLWHFSALGILLSLLSLALGDSAQEVLAENAKLSNESLLWGPYRPNLYFGVRPRIPKSLTTGLLWAKVDSFQGVQNSMSPTHCSQKGPQAFNREGTAIC